MRFMSKQDSYELHVTGFIQVKKIHMRKQVSYE